MSHLGALRRDLEAELARPCVVHDTLRNFLLMVYSDATAMAGGDNIADRIYELYNDSSAAGEAPRISELRKFLDDLILAIQGWKGEPPFLQNLDEKLLDMRRLGRKKEDWEAFRNHCADFIYFVVNHGRAAVRVYANVQYDSVPDVIEFLVKLAATKDGGGMTAFKVCGPAIIRSRTDAIVIYCKDKSSADSIAKTFVSAEWASRFNPMVPGMTTQLSAGVGIATGAEPEWQATGLGAPKFTTKVEGKEVPRFLTMRSMEPLRVSDRSEAS